MTSAPRRHAAAPSAAIALLAIVAGAVVGWVGWTGDRHQFFASYLVAWLYWAGFSLGSISLLLLHNLSGGKWGHAVRPQLRAAASTLPLAAVLFLPIALNLPQLYEWTDAAHVEADPILKHKAPYLNADWFQIRAAGYAALWLALLVLLSWQGRANPVAGTRAEQRLRRLSGQGLGLHGLAVTFASIDWMMSLEPHWFSTIYGVIVFVAFGLAAFALAIGAATAAELRGAPDASHLDAQHDCGKLLLGFTMLWAYVTFSQAFIIWYGDLPEEVVYYIKRTTGGWMWASLSLVLLHFATPFVLLLGRQWKRDPRRLGGVATLILGMHGVHLVWMVEPAIDRESSVRYFPWLDAGLTAAIGGAWWFLYSWLVPRYSRALPAMPKDHRHG